MFNIIAHYALNANHFENQTKCTWHVRPSNGIPRNFQGSHEFSKLKFLHLNLEPVFRRIFFWTLFLYFLGHIFGYIFCGTLFGTLFLRAFLLGHFFGTFIWDTFQMRQHLLLSSCHKVTDTFSVSQSIKSQSLSSLKLRLHSIQVNQGHLWVDLCLSPLNMFLFCFEIGQQYYSGPANMILSHQLSIIFRNLRMDILRQTFMEAP